jgi:hypothetical protein
MPPFVSGGCDATDVIFGRREVREAGVDRKEEIVCVTTAPVIFSTLPPNASPGSNGLA